MQKSQERQNQQERWMSLGCPTVGTRIAAACYASAGDQASSARGRLAAQSWQNKLESRYQGHQLRLRVALDRGRNDNAIQEIRSLKRLLRGKNGPFLNWLEIADRRLRGV